MKQAIFVFVLCISLVNCLPSEQITIQSLDDTNLWDKCIDFPILGESCLDIYAVLPNLTLAASLTIANKTYLDFPLLEGNKKEMRIFNF